MNRDQRHYFRLGRNDGGLRLLCAGTGICGSVSPLWYRAHLTGSEGAYGNVEDRSHPDDAPDAPRISALWEEKYGRKPEEKDVKELFGLFEEKLMSILHLFAGPKPGVAETVKALREKGIAIGSTTGYTDKMMADCGAGSGEKGIRSGRVVQSGFCKSEGPPVPLYDLSQYGSSGAQRRARRSQSRGYGFRYQRGKKCRRDNFRRRHRQFGNGAFPEEYESLSEEEQKQRCEQVAEKFLAAGADRAILNLEDLLKIV